MSQRHCVLEKDFSCQPTSKFLANSRQAQDFKNPAEYVELHYIMRMYYMELRRAFMEIIRGTGVK